MPPRWPATTVIAALAAAADALVTGAAPLTALYALGLGAALGLVIGLVWTLLGAALARLPDRIHRVAAPLAHAALGLAGGLWLADALGALARLGGPHHALALAALIGAPLAGLALALALAALHPAPAGPLARHPRLTTAALLIGAAALTAADRRLFVDLYPDAHAALRVAAILLAAAALHRWRPARRPRLALALGTLALAALAFTALHRDADRPLGQLHAAPHAALALDALRALTDLDRDGASHLLGGADTAPFDPAIITPAPPPPPDPYPSALPPLPTAPPTQSVVLITIDTLRPDRMSLYGHPRLTTPHLDAFAQNALRYDRAYTPGAWTSLAISSMLRGLPPRQIRWTRLAETNRFRLIRHWQTTPLEDGERLRLMFGLPLEDPRPPLPEQLARRGLHTIAVVDDGYSRFLSAEMGTDRGFADFRSVDTLPRPRRTDAGTTDLALAALADRPQGRPYFMWVHYFGPHDPSTRRRGAPWYGDGIADAYDHEIRYADLHLGRLLTHLDALPDPPAVVITSDHGEIIGDTRRLHGIELHPTVLHIPLVIRAPGLTPGQTDRLASLVDLAPTILALTTTPAPAWMPGVDLTAPVEPPARIITTDTWRYDRHGQPVYDQTATLDGRHMLILDRVRNTRRLWALDDHARRPTDLRGETPADALEAALDAYLTRTAGGRVDLHD